MALGRVDTWDVTDPNEQDADFIVVDCWIHDVALEYRGAPGVWAGFVANSTFEHNTLERLGYAGFHIGWQVSSFQTLHIIFHVPFASRTGVGGWQKAILETTVLPIIV